LTPASRDAGRVRRVVVVIVAAAMLIGLGFAGWATTRHHRTNKPPIDNFVLRPEAARADAVRACTLMTEVENDIRENASSDQVLSLLNRADQASRRAQSKDPLWTQLASGVQAVRRGILDDDGGLAGGGIRVVRAQCPLTQLPPPG
jgi:hypothetical protein